MDNSEGKLRAIETRYAGCRFRSRLEARWAAFYDALRIPWSHEFEGFVLPSGTYYLPDFYLPDQELWIEIKGSDDDVEGIKRFFEFASVQQNSVMFIGDIPDPRFVDSYGPRGDCCGHIYCDQDYAWCTCPDCGRLGVEFDGRGARVCGGQGALPGITKGKRCRCDQPHGDKSFSGNDPRILAAYATARSKRFEHGEQE